MRRKKASEKAWVLLLFLLPACTLFSEAIHFPGLDGNRILQGPLDLKGARVAQVKLPSAPSWIAGYPYGEANMWFVLLEDSRIVQIIHSRDGALNVNRLDKPYPVYTKLSVKDNYNGTYKLFGPAAYGENFSNRPVSLPGGLTARISRNGELFIKGAGRERRIAEDLLFDGQILTDGKGWLLILGPESSRYNHGILGDGIEPIGFSVIDTGRSPGPVHSFLLSGRDVFETLSPVWADITGSPEREIIITKSNTREGALLEVYRQDGTFLAGSDPIGMGYRWMHLLAAGPFGPKGEMEIAAVRTPHIGGVLEYYRLEGSGSDGSRLVKVHRKPGYSTHRIGSRNLDTAIGGDFDGEEGMELLLPSEDFSRIDAVKRTAHGSEVIYSLSLDGKLSTNIAGFTHKNTIRVALGTASGTVYFFHPR